MTRTPKEAAEGRLNLLVGGEADLLELCRPVLASFAETILHAGAVGAGHRMKLLHNFVSLGLITLIAEAAACAKQSGIGSEVFVDVLARGGGGGVALERLKPYLLTADTGALGFSIANARKDLGYYGTMAADTGADRTVADAVLDSLTRAAHAEPEAMVPELVRIIAATLRDNRYVGAINAVAPESIDNRAFARALGRTLRRPAVLPVPAVALHAMYGEASTTLLSSQFVLPAALQSLGFSFAFPTVQTALTDIVGGVDVQVRSVEDTTSAGRSATGRRYLETRRPTHELVVTTRLESPVDQAFPFFSKAENLGLLTPAAMGLPQPPQAHRGGRFATLAAP